MRILLTLLLIGLSNGLMADSIFMVPDKNWGFQFSSPKLMKQKGNASKTEYQFQASTGGGFVVSGFVEPAKGKGADSASCMKYYWEEAVKNPSILKDTISVVAQKPFAVVTYLIDTEYKGKRYIQVNANYYGFREGDCIDFHVSQVFPDQAEIDFSNMLEFGKTFGYYQ